MVTTFTTLFGETASSQRLRTYLDEIASKSGIDIPEAEVKSYSDAVYFNYYNLGLSLLFIPAEGYKPSSTSAPEYTNLLLDSVDVFNTINNAVPSKSRTYSRFPLLPLAISLSPESESLPIFELAEDTAGKELVQALGEPTRKGGGAGPSSGSIGIWCEWAKLGIMVEFGGDEARGPQAWERGKDAVWKFITVFKPKDE